LKPPGAVANGAVLVLPLKLNGAPTVDVAVVTLLTGDKGLGFCAPKVKPPTFDDVVAVSFVSAVEAVEL
jgi:hypothetical protein